MIDMPYFMENEDWYTFDDGFVLTDKAPEKAKKSYKQWLKDVDKDTKPDTSVAARITEQQQRRLLVKTQR